MTCKLDHSPPTPTPSPFPVFPTQSYLSQLPSTSLHHRNTMVHMAASTLDLLQGVSWNADVTIFTPSSSSTHYHFPLSHSATSCRAALVLRGQRTASCVAGVLLSISKVALWLVLSPSSVTQICTCSQPIRDAFTSVSVTHILLLILSPPNQPHCHVISLNDIEHRPLTCHPYSVRDTFHHDVGAASGSQPLQPRLPFTSHLTRPQAVHESPNVTLLSFAEGLPRICWIFIEQPTS
ncbi:hypothetical protein BU17DRAFT_94676 [Hysterangium stoloniferum]|nr:hypothetical protein BU17DRAFT_94676 [Hysterangium stoloniferum]